MPNIHQVSFFDLNENDTKNKSMANKEAVLDNSKDIMAKDIINKNVEAKIDKVQKAIRPTKGQQKFLDYTKVIDNDNLSRIILYAGGGLGIEFKDKNGFMTLYLNSLGDKEFSVFNKIPVLPGDKIFYYKFKYELNYFQLQSLEKVRKKFKNIKRIIHRHGDENILVEIPGKILDINSRGLVLEFNEITHIDCEYDEILCDFDKLALVKNILPGDYIKALIGKSTVNALVIDIDDDIVYIDFWKNDTIFRAPIHKKCVVSRGEIMTKIGKFLRKLRFEKSQVLYEMAAAIGISSSDLSDIEFGIRKMNTLEIAKVIQVYDLDREQTIEIRRIAEE